MRCSFPILAKNKEGQVVSVPCGRCTACRVNYQQEWKARVAHELKAHENNCWIMLSYDDLHLSLQNLEYRDLDGRFNSLEKREIILWKKRFQKELYPLKVRFFGCGEYGGEGNRPHYHFAVFGLDKDHPIFKKIYKDKRKGWWCRLDSWPYGNVWVDDEQPTPDVGSYIAKYILKKHKGKDTEEYYNNLNVNPEFVSMSLKPGIGAGKIDDFAEHYMQQPFVYMRGHKIPLSRYMKNRIAQAMEDKFGEIWDVDSVKYHFKKLASDFIKPKLTEEEAFQQERYLKKICAK